MYGISKLRITKNIKNCRTVSTWSSLAKAFNTTGKGRLKLNFTKKETGLFNVPELKTADGFAILKNLAVAQTRDLIDEVTDQNRKRKMVAIFDELSDTLCKVADLAEFIRIAHPEEEYVRAAEDACISISGIVEQLNTHYEMYNALKQITLTNDIQDLSPMDKHVAKLFLFDFEQCGIHLPEDRRRKVVELNDYILQVGQKFMTGAVNPRAVNANVLPENIRRCNNPTHTCMGILSFTVEDGQIIISGLYTDSSNTMIREAAYKLYLYPDPQQDYLLQELLNSRHQLAQLCEFPSYVHRAVKGSTVERPEVVKDFLDILTNELRSSAEAEFKEMQKMKDEELNVRQELMPWDTAYFTAKAKKSWYDTSSAEFAPYFSLGACMDGINILSQALYGIRLESVPVLTGEVWADDVQKLVVMDEQEGILGHIYCDFFEREGKPNQDCHFTIRGGRQLSDGSYQNPIVVLMLSLPPPRWSNPCLLNPSSVDNLFHEMGHALHSMLGRTQYQHVTGTRCCTDFAEVPSVLMEYFASDPRVVSLFAKHFQTQQTMPQNLLDKFCLSKTIFPASELQNQVFYSMLDHVYHSNKLDRSTTDILADVQGKYYGLPYVKNTAWQLRFSHLVGYGAKYYSYLISRAIASWIWQSYFQNDPLSRSAGERYRRECLAYGGSKPSSQLVADFLNKEASAANFAKSLMNEINAKNELQAVKR